MSNETNSDRFDPAIMAHFHNLAERDFVLDDTYWKEELNAFLIVFPVFMEDEFIEVAKAHNAEADRVTLLVKAMQIMNDEHKELRAAAQMLVDLISDLNNRVHNLKDRLDALEQRVATLEVNTNAQGN